MRPAVSTFDSAWALASTAAGWLTEDQGRLLWDEARCLVAGATVLEIGSFQGRSTIVLGSAVAERGGHVVAVDPFVDDWKFGDPRTRTKFEAHIAASGLVEVVEHRRGVLDDGAADLDEAVGPALHRRQARRLDGP